MIQWEGRTRREWEKEKEKKRKVTVGFYFLSFLFTAPSSLKPTNHFPQKLHPHQPHPGIFTKRSCSLLGSFWKRKVKSEKRKEKKDGLPVPSLGPNPSASSCETHGLEGIKFLLCLSLEILCECWYLFVFSLRCPWRSRSNGFKLKLNELRRPQKKLRRRWPG